MRHEAGHPDLAALIAAAAGAVLADDARLVIAVSGGPDSTALLALAAEQLPGRITAMSVDHGLSAAASAACGDIARQCAARGIPHVTLSWEGVKPSSNIQAHARAARYRLLADWCVAYGHGVLLTAHHADDQAETLLMRLARGSGSGGLSGIRARRVLAGGTLLLRPLLGLRRAALAGLAAGWTTYQDPANSDPRHDRTAARALLETTPWLSAKRMAQAAENLAHAASALDWAEERAWAGAARHDGPALLIDAAGLPAELAMRLVRRAVLALAPQARPRGTDIARLAARLGAGSGGTVAGVKATPVATGVAAGSWRFVPAPQRHVPDGNSVRNAL